MRRLLRADRLDQALGVVGLEIAVVAVSVNAKRKAFGVAFGVELRRIHVLADAKHLYRTARPGHQQRCARRGRVAGFLVSEQYGDPIGKSGEQGIALARFGEIEHRQTHGLAVAGGDRRSEVRAEQAVAGAGAQEREVARDEVVEQAIEVALDPALDRGLSVPRGTDVEGAAADDQRGVVVQTQILGDAGVLDAQPPNLPGSKPAVPEDRRELAVGGVVFGTDLQDEKRFRHGRGDGRSRSRRGTLRSPRLSDNGAAWGRSSQACMEMQLPFAGGSER
jgi:hypothetical protein